jgi:hypothetical protein
VCKRFLLAHSVLAAWGEPTRPGFPRRGKRERGSSDFLAAAGRSRWRSANVWHAAGLLCARSSSMFLSIPITNRYVDSARSAFSKPRWRHPLLCRASIRTLMGPHWARCMLGSDLKPRSTTTVTDLGLLGAAIFTAISAKDQWGFGTP